jgi:sucrose-6-phosphate hydrolase SacC (GH32 family)
MCEHRPVGMTGDSYDGAAPGAPAFHLAPPLGWMNDPNGLIVVDGVVQACYQHTPDSDVWGPMHWRRATSTDFVTWVDRGIVLAPDVLGTVFSGSVVRDRTGTAGFGDDALVAVYTQDHPDGQVQSLASSVDGGTTWRPFDGNPVLTREGAPAFRDPRVHRRNDRWVMALAVGEHLEFFVSDDLREWQMTGAFHDDAFGSGPAECPELIWFDDACVLLASTPDGRVVAWAGEWHDDRFVAGEVIDPAEPFDLGPDCYALQSFGDVDGELDGAPIVMAWMSRWSYANTHPSRGRRGVMTIPRRLSFVDGRLHQRPVLHGLSTTVADGHVHPGPASGAIITATGAFRAIVAGEAGEAVTITGGPGTIRVERSLPRAIEERPDLTATCEVPWHSGVAVVVVDHGTVELFADGRSASMLCFPGLRWSVATEGAATVVTARPTANRRSADR